MVPKKLTAQSLRARKQTGPKITAITAYDFQTAALIDPLVDLILVGDSLGMVFQGHDSTLPVTMEQMLYHTKAVAKAVKHAHLVADMPFMSYQTSTEDALRNAGRFLSEAGAAAVKLEGGVVMAKTIERLVETGIPVLGHIGLTPQSVNQFGGYKIQGRTTSSRDSLLEDARAIEDSGAYAVVLEGIPSELGEVITKSIKIPTIGIGAGVHCDGQILVVTDLLGLDPGFKPRFVKRYADLASLIQKAVGQYATEVQAGSFPDKDHSFYVDP